MAIVSSVRDEYAAIARGDRGDGPMGRVAFCTSTDDLDSGRGDLYVGLGLAAALVADGWGVSLWPMDRWGEPGPAGADVAIVMLESHVPGLIPAGTRTVAWVRNKAAEWARLPYIDRFDAVWCSSSLSADHLRSVTSRPVSVLPLGTDPGLFQSEAGERDPRAVLTANYWGAERGIFQEVSGTASGDRDYVWYGANFGGWLATPEHVEYRGQADYFDLGHIYASHRYVIDDLIAPAVVYGNQNSRLFDAIAAGAVVVTNTRNGLDELGLSRVPVYEPGTLASVLDELDRDPDALAALADELRSAVLRRHTWAHRAALAGELIEAVVAARPVDHTSPILALAAVESARRRDFETRFWAAHLEVEQLRGEVANYNAQVEGMLGSVSWRVTAPLRALRGAISRN